MLPLRPLFRQIVAQEPMAPAAPYEAFIGVDLFLLDEILRPQPAPKAAP